MHSSLNNISWSRIHILDPVLFRGTPEPGAMTKISQDLWIASVIRELILRANDASLEGCWCQGTLWRQSTFLWVCCIILLRLSGSNVMTSHCDVRQWIGMTEGQRLHGMCSSRKWPEFWSEFRKNMYPSSWCPPTEIWNEDCEIQVQVGSRLYVTSPLV